MAGTVDVATLVARLKADTGNFERGMRGAQGDLRKTETAVSRTAKRLAIGLGTAAVAAGAAAVKMGIDYEKSMSRIEGLVGIAADEVARMGTATLKLAGETARAPKELGDALFFVTSAGLRGQEAMDVLEQSARAAAAGLGDTAVIADAVTSAVNAYGSENLSASSATDILTAAVREGKLEASTLAPVLGRLIPISSQLQIEFDEVAGFLAAMSRTGLDANEAATSLRGVMAKLVKPTKQGSEALEAVGLSAEGLRRQAGEEGLLPVLRSLDAAFAGNEEAMGLVFEDIRGLTGVMNILGQDAETVDGIMQGVADSTGATDRAFEAASETADFKLRQAMAKLQTIGIDLASDALPAIADAADSASEALGDLATAIAVVRDVIGEFRDLDERLSKSSSLWGRFKDASGDALQRLTPGSREIRNVVSALGEMSEEQDRAAVAVDVQRRAMDSYVSFLESRAQKALADTTDAEDELADASDRVTSALGEQRLAALALTDPFFAVRKATADLKDAEDALAKVMKESPGDADAVAEARLGVAEAGLEVAGSSQALIDVLADEGTSIGEVIVRTSDLLKAQGAAPEVIAAFESAMRSSGEEAAETAEKIGTASDDIVAAVESTLARAEVVARQVGAAISRGVAEGVRGAKADVAHALRGVVDEGVAAGRRRAELRSPSRLFAREVGRPIAEGVAAGIGEGRRFVEVAISDLVDRAVGEARGALGAFTGAFGAARGVETARRRVADAEEALRHAREQAEFTPMFLAQAEQALANAREEATKVTLQEERATLQAQADLTRSQQRLTDIHEDAEATATELRLAEIDVMLAEQRLTEQREASVAPTSARVAELERKVADLRVEEEGVTDNLRTAEDDLTGARLNLVEAQRQLWESGQDIIDQGPAAVGFFEELAKQAGISQEAIDDLVGAYRDLAEAQAGAAGAGAGAVARKPASQGGKPVSGVAGDPAFDTAAAAAQRVADIFSNRGVRVGTGKEKEQARLDRIAGEVLSGKRTFDDVRKSVDWIRKNVPGDVIKMDTGLGVLAPGLNAVLNNTGAPEPIVDPRRMGGTLIDITIHAGMGTDGRAVGRQVVEALRGFQRENGAIPIRVTGS